MKNFIMAIAVLLAFACNNNIVSSKNVYQNKEITNANGATILLGHTAPYMLKQGSYQHWFEKTYLDYHVDSNISRMIAPLIKNKTIEIFLGTWCGDSRREVPRMIKVLDEVGFDTSRFKLIMVDNAPASYKQSPQHEESGKNIHHVPTFIIYHGKKEVGRIVETPKVSLEKDLLSIPKHEAYIPKYAVVAEWQKIEARDKLKTDAELDRMAALLKSHSVSPNEFNGYGYLLLSQDKKAEAGNVLRLNALLFPSRPGVFSSLADYYLSMRDTSAAKTNYEKVLQLDPNDTKTKKILADL